MACHDPVYTFSKPLKFGVNDTLPEDFLDDSPSFSELVQHGKDDESDFEKENIFDVFGPKVIDFTTHFSTRESKEEKKKSLGEVSWNWSQDKRDSLKSDTPNSIPMPLFPTSNWSNMTSTPKKISQPTTPLKSSFTRTFASETISDLTGEISERKIHNEMTPKLKEENFQELATPPESPLSKNSVEMARLLMNEEIPEPSMLPSPQDLIRKIDFWWMKGNEYAKYPSEIDTKILGYQNGTYGKLRRNPNLLKHNRDAFVKLYNWWRTPEDLKQEIISLDIYRRDDKMNFGGTIIKRDKWLPGDQNDTLLEIFSKYPHASEKFMEHVSREINIPAECIKNFYCRYLKHLKNFKN